MAQLSCLIVLWAHSSNTALKSLAFRPGTWAAPCFAASLHNRRTDFRAVQQAPVISPKHSLSKTEKTISLLKGRSLRVLSFMVILEYVICTSPSVRLSQPSAQLFNDVRAALVAQKWNPICQVNPMQDAATNRSNTLSACSILALPG